MLSTHIKNKKIMKINKINDFMIFTILMYHKNLIFYVYIYF
jgi:hypothetical protein